MPSINQFNSINSIHPASFLFLSFPAVGIFSSHSPAHVCLRLYSLQLKFLAIHSLEIETPSPTCTNSPSCRSQISPHPSMPARSCPPAHSRLMRPAGRLKTWIIHFYLFFSFFFFPRMLTIDSSNMQLKCLHNERN